MWFNRKLTQYAQALRDLEKRVNAVEIGRQADKSANDRNMLEFAELGEKMRRTYLRLSRIVKVDSQPSSEDAPAVQSDGPQPSAQETRDEINQRLGL